MDRLSTILTSEASGNADDFRFVLSVVNSAEPVKSIQLAVQCVEKCCRKNPEFVGAALTSLLELLAGTQERNLRIVAAQALSRLCRLLSSSTDWSLFAAEFGKVSHLYSSDNLVQRSFNEIKQVLAANLTVTSVTASANTGPEDPIPECAGAEEESCDDESSHRDDNDDVEEEETEHGELGNMAPADIALLSDSIADLTPLEFVQKLKEKEHLTALRAVLSQVKPSRWLELFGRLKGFYRECKTNAKLIEKHMRLSSSQVRWLVEISGIRYHPVQTFSEPDFRSVLSVIEYFSSEERLHQLFAELELSNPWLVSPEPVQKRSSGRISRFRDSTAEEKAELVEDGEVTQEPAPTTYREQYREQDARSRDVVREPLSRGSRAHSIGETNGREHDDATCALLIQNLPVDVRVPELFVLLERFSGCSGLQESDIIMPPNKTRRGDVSGAHAYVQFKHIKEARRAKQALDGREFDDHLIRVEYSLGRPTKSVWLGALPSALTKEDIEAFMKGFGELERVDYRRGSHGDNFAFAVFAKQDSATAAIKHLTIKCGSQINGHSIRVGYGASTAVEGASSTNNSDSRSSVRRETNDESISPRHASHEDRRRQKEDSDERVNRRQNSRSRSRSRERDSDPQDSFRRRDPAFDSHTRSDNREETSVDPHRYNYDSRPQPRDDRRGRSSSQENDRGRKSHIASSGVKPQIHDFREERLNDSSHTRVSRWGNSDDGLKESFPRDSLESSRAVLAKNLQSYPGSRDLSRNQPRDNSENSMDYPRDQFGRSRDQLRDQSQVERLSRDDSRDRFDDEDYLRDQPREYSRNQTQVRDYPKDQSRDQPREYPRDPPRNAPGVHSRVEDYPRDQPRDYPRDQSRENSRIQPQARDYPKVQSSDRPRDQRRADTRDQLRDEGHPFDQQTREYPRSQQQARDYQSRDQPREFPRDQPRNDMRDQPRSDPRNQFRDEDYSREQPKDYARDQSKEYLRIEPQARDYPRDQSGQSKDRDQPRGYSRDSAGGQPRDHYPTRFSGGQSRDESKDQSHRDYSTTYLKDEHRDPSPNQPRGYDNDRPRDQRGGMSSNVNRFGDSGDRFGGRSNKRLRE